MPVPPVPEDEDYIAKFIASLDPLTDEQLDAIADVLALMRIHAAKADQ
jgi:hypothetical protein